MLNWLESRRKSDAATEVTTEADFIKLHHSFRVDLRRFVDDQSSSIAARCRALEARHQQQ